MTHRSALLVFASALTLLVASLANAPRARALDCGGRLVEVGDSAARVRIVCGEPTSITPRTEYVSTYVTPNGSTSVVRVPGCVVGAAVQVVVEVWVYDFGPRRLMQEIVIANGTVRSMRTLGYPPTPGPRAVPRGRR